MKHRKPHQTTGSSVAYHNRVARRYDHIYSENDHYWRFHDEVTWRVVKPHLPRDLKLPCLDLGCGTGKWGLKLRKSGFITTFVDHSPGMIGQVREKLDDTEQDLGVVADIIDLPMLPSDHYALVLAMGDPLSICTDPLRAAAEMFRLTMPGGTVIATADNRIAAFDHFLTPLDIDGLERLHQTRRTNWLTRDRAEQFQTTTFTPAELRTMFEKVGFKVSKVMGKTVLPIRSIRDKLADPGLFRRLIEIEMDLEKQEDLASRASHLQIVAHRR